MSLLELTHDWGDVTPERSRVSSRLALNAPAPVALELDAVSVHYEALLNDERLLVTDDKTVSLGEAGTEIAMHASLDHDDVPRWWAEHVARGERSELAVEPSLEVGGRFASASVATPTIRGTVDTDIAANIEGLADALADELAMLQRTLVGRAVLAPVGTATAWVVDEDVDVDVDLEDATPADLQVGADQDGPAADPQIGADQDDETAADPHIGSDQDDDTATADPRIGADEGGDTAVDPRIGAEGDGDSAVDAETGAGRDGPAADPQIGADQDDETAADPHIGADDDGDTADEGGAADSAATRGGIGSDDGDGSRVLQDAIDGETGDAEAATAVAIAIQLRNGLGLRFPATRIDRFLLSLLGFRLVMNDVVLGHGRFDDVASIPSGEQRTYTVTIPLDDAALKEWWASHVDRGEHTNVEIDVVLDLPLGLGRLRRVLHSYSEDLRTDVLAAVTFST